MTTSSAAEHELSVEPFSYYRRSRFRSFPLVLLRPGRSHLNSADERSFRQANDTEHDFGNVFGRNLPVRAALTGFPGKMSRHAPWHDVRHADVVVTVIQHRRLAQPIQSEF